MDFAGGGRALPCPPQMCLGPLTSVPAWGSDLARASLATLAVVPARPPLVEGQPPSSYPHGAEVFTGVVSSHRSNFGFIQRDDGCGEMFVVPGACREFGGKIPPAGTRVRFTVVTDSKTGRPRAHNVQPLPGEVPLEHKADPPAGPPDADMLNGFTERWGWGVDAKTCFLSLDPDVQQTVMDTFAPKNEAGVVCSSRAQFGRDCDGKFILFARGVEKAKYGTTNAAKGKDGPLWGKGGKFGRGKTARGKDGALWLWAGGGTSAAFAGDDQSGPSCSAAPKDGELPHGSPIVGGPCASTALGGGSSCIDLSKLGDLRNIDLSSFRASLHTGMAEAPSTAGADEARAAVARATSAFGVQSLRAGAAAVARFSPY